MTVNVFRNSTIRNSDQCSFDRSEGYSIAWDTDSDFKGYTSYENLTARLVANGVYFSVLTAASGSLTASNNISEIDAGVYTHIKVNMRLDVDTSHTQPTKGKIEFRTEDDISWDPSKAVEFPVTPDNSYKEYTIDMSTLREWQGNVVRLKLSPVVDGSAGTKVHLRHIKVVSLFNFSCATKFLGDICSHYSQYRHPCPFIGKGAIARGVTVSERLSIVSGVNDKLIVNINGFGRQSITLEEVNSALIRDIARDIETKLNLIGVGGYAYAKCYVENSKFIIESDTRDSSSTISVEEPSSRSAGLTLGFFDSLGNKLCSESVGEEPASRYTPEGSLKIGRSAINTLYSPSVFEGNRSLFTITPNVYFPQGGNEKYKFFNRDTKISFVDKTFIDYSSPVTENGTITFAAFSGDANEDTEFRIYRQRLDGSIYLVGSENFGASNNSTDSLFEVACNIQVQKGDLLGLYSASVHTGRDTEIPNFSYVLYDGDLQENSFSLPLEGSGEEGAPIFCRGSEKADKAVLLATFDAEETLEAVNISASEEARVEILPLCKVQSGGLNGGPNIEAYTGYGTDGSKAPEWTGLEYVLDGSKLDVNGESPSAYPTWYNTVNRSNYDYTEAGIILDFAKGVDVLFDIHRVVVFFGADKNIKAFTVDYPLNTNSQDTLRNWQVVTGRYNEVYIDDALTDSARYFYTNPSFVKISNYHEDYVALKYRSIDFRFDPVKARSIRYRGYLELNEQNSSYYSDSLAKFPIYEDPRIQEIEVYAKSIPESSIGDNFVVMTSSDNSTYLTHTDIDELSSTDIRFTIGRPSKYLKLIVNPTSNLSFSNVYADVSRATSRVVTNVGDGEALLNVSTNEPSIDSGIIVVTNDSSEVSNFYIDIADEHYKREECILWNKLGSTEEIENSEIGPGGIVRKRDNFRFSVTNVALGAPAYILNPNFLSDSPCYVTYDSGSTWEDIGNIVVNGSKLDGISNESAGHSLHPKVYVTVDAVRHYDFLSISPVKQSTNVNDSGWSSTIYFSNSSASSPSSVPANSWSLDYSNARWIRLEATAVPPGTPYDSGKATLGYIKAIPDVFSVRSYGYFPWVQESRLTNGIAGTSAPEGWIKSGYTEYYCVDLQKKYSIKQVITGPVNCFQQPLDGDISSLCGAVLDADKKDENIAFSGTNTDNPALVQWQPFGVAAPGSVRWVMVKSSICDEIGVLVDDEDSLNKSIYELTRWWSSKSGQITVDTNEYCVPFGSISIDYPAARGPTREYIQLSTSLGYDNDLAPRDALSLCLYVSNITQLDGTYGFIKLGRSTSEDFSFNDQGYDIDNSNFFVWDISGFYSSLVNGWNFLTLPFTDPNKIGEPCFTSNLSGSSVSDKRRSRFTNLTVEFRGIQGNQKFTVKVDNIEILRSYFPEAAHGAGLYLTGGEYAKFPLNGFNPIAGCIEFFIDPDWSREIGCNTCEMVGSHTIFRFMNSSWYYMYFIVTTGGIEVYVSNGVKTLVSVDDSLEGIRAGSRSHIAFVWDFNPDSDSLFEIYVNNKLSSSYRRESLQSDFDVSVCKDVFLMLGGKGWSGFTLQDAYGLDGVLDNIKVYNYPKRDFLSSIALEGLEQIKKSRDMVTISTDGVSFYGYEDRGTNLPILVSNVQPGSSFNVYVKARDISLTEDGQRNRNSYVEVIRSRSG